MEENKKMEDYKLHALPSMYILHMIFFEADDDEVQLIHNVSRRRLCVMKFNKYCEDLYLNEKKIFRVVNITESCSTVRETIATIVENTRLTFYGYYENADDFEGKIERVNAL